LLRLALAGRPQFDVDDQELRRGGISYTIDTVDDYIVRFPGAALFYLIGADHLAPLPKWRSANELAGKVTFVVVPRPGQPQVSLPPPFRGKALEGFPFGVSASQIRDRIRAGKPIDYLLPSAVAEAIRNNQLYL
jgi:nicotinate-nucleotide adenylyltransferase